MPAYRLSLLALTLASLALTGCPQMRPNVLAPPGPMRQQQITATVHDPYPNHQLGPAVEGARPRDYEQPLPEPVRTRLFLDRWWLWPQ